MSTFLSVQNPKQMFDNPSKEALRHLGKAIYVELNLDDKVKILEKKYVSKNMRLYGPYLYGISKVLLEKRVSYTWRF